MEEVMLVIASLMLFILLIILELNIIKAHRKRYNKVSYDDKGLALVLFIVDMFIVGFSRELSIVLIIIMWLCVRLFNSKDM